MPGINSLLELGKRALQTQQTALNIIGHNIANANRSEYTRQQIEYKASVPEKSPYGFIGTGVEIASIVRQRDRFIDFQVREQYSMQGEWSRREQILSQAEKVFNEPSDTGLNQIMSSFWDGWQELMNNPESTSVRAALRQRANHMTSQFHYLHDQLKGMRKNLNDELTQTVNDINYMAQQIAAINETIRIPESSTNDILDERDKFLDDLAKLVKINFVENSDKTVSVLIDGHAIVDGTNTHLLETKSSLEDAVVIDQIVWGSTNSVVNVGSGDLKGLFDLRDNVLPDYLDRLDRLAVAIAQEVNAAHETGYGLDGSTNNNFFLATTTGADNFALADDILDDLDKIAAAGINASGDNSNAEAIYNLRDREVLNNNTQTIEQFYNILIGDLGTTSQEAIFTNETQELIINQMENQRQSAIGVSIDEEMVNMIKIQNAYQAATKVISTTNEMMNTIISII